MNKLAIATAIAATITGAAYAQESRTSPIQTQVPATSPIQTQVLIAIPQNVTTVTNFYKQNVYDPSDVKVGEINDVLVDNDGKIGAFIIGVGGFLGVGEKDVAVPFNSVHAAQRNGKWWLTMNATKDSLTGAPGYKYDKVKATWVPA
jgi:sporulation protein YlmC with PRC-barrel domain